MRKIKNLLVLLTTLSLIFGLLACEAPSSSEHVSTTAPTTEAPTEPPVSSMYTQAAQTLRDATDLSIELTAEKTITTGIETFNQVSDLELILTGIGTEAFAASVSEELEIDDISNEFTEFFTDGVLYVDIDNAGCFQGDMTKDAFLARFAPAALLDETLYNNISTEETDTGVTLIFSDPAEAESWALPAGAELLSASGSAKISNTGELTKTTYTIEYTQSNTTVSMEFSSKAEIYDDDPIEKPSEPDTYTEIDHIESPRLYATAAMYLYRAETASSTITEIMICQAANYMLAEEAELHYTGTGKDHISEVKYTANLTNGSSTPETFSQTESYKDGVYTRTAEDGSSETDADITLANMYAYLQSFYDGNLPNLEYVSSAKAEDVAGLLYLEMELNEEWGENVAKTLNYTIFGDEDYLSNYASDYKTTASAYYMVLDPATGFPVSAGTTYSGIHTIEGSDYILSYEISQSYRLANSGTYETLAGETPPEKQATPLLYHVTGADGQEMYLMGTIHIGDARTAFLPDEVYDAFEASDSLAVEADIMSMEQKLESDQELAAQYVAACTNPDGKTTKDLLDADTYNRAIKLLKASGNYNSNVEYMKPFVWDSTIANFHVSLGQFSSDKGMDMRLLKLAKEQDKEILEVESVLFQLEMGANFSTELQVMMLEADVHSTVAESRDKLEDLYELWCSGDEAALREMIKDDTSDLSEEELALYQEYLDAMIIKRNENMLDVAISYLESDDTVFYAVGLAHLLQENGLVDTLKDAGYTVEQVIYN